MTQFIATINTPGYLPEGDEPAVFATPAEAWQYLADERRSAEDNFPEWSTGNGSDYSATYINLSCIATAFKAGTIDQLRPDITPNTNGTGTMYGATPGYAGTHDLGLAYSVSVVETRTVKAEALTRGNFIVTVTGEHKEISYTDWQGSRIFVVFMDGRTSPYDKGDDVEILNN